MPASNTIFALSSGSGRSAIAVIRVSGPRAVNALQSMVTRLPEPRVAALRRILDPATGEELDAALVFRFDGPASETGEDLVELQVHGGRAVVQAVLGALGRIEGLRPAEPGEFVRRAFANHKLDLTAVEGLADLIDAETEQQRRRAVRQAGGALAKLYDGWRARLIEAQGLVEAAIDFADEGDVSASAVSQGYRIAELLAGEITAHQASNLRGEILRDGFHVVIAGVPNAGKSSLLNALARRDVAIVAAEAGTTRDVIEVRLDLDGLPVVLADTAGLRTVAAGSVEAEGIWRTRRRAEEADLVLWLVDATEPVFTPLDGIGRRGSPSLVVFSKIDLVSAPPPRDQASAYDLAISVIDGTGIETLLGLLATAAKEAAGDADALVPTSARHRLHLRKTSEALASFLTGDPAQTELRAEELRIAASELGRLTGRIDAEDVLDQVFGRFCIGK